MRDRGIDSPPKPAIKQREESVYTRLSSSARKVDWLARLGDENALERLRRLSGVRGEDGFGGEVGRGGGLAEVVRVDIDGRGEWMLLALNLYFQSCKLGPKGADSVSDRCEYMTVRRQPIASSATFLLRALRF